MIANADAIDANSDRDSEPLHSCDSTTTTTANTAQVVNNRFANDGSFMQMFMQMQAQLKSGDSVVDSTNSSDNATETVADVSLTDTLPSSTSSSSSGDASVTSTTATTAIAVKNSSSTVSALTGKRRIKKTLKVGVIKKQRADTDADGNADNSSGKSSDSAWTRYMNEVRQYKEKYGDDGDKNRPLVK